MLTPFQEEIAVTISAITDEKGFALAGGAALISLGLVDRHTRDLDFFTSNAGAVNQTCPLVEAALRSNGMEVVRRVDAPGFVRLEVTRGDELCEVDLGNDARLLPVTQTELGRVLATDELAADKMLALFGRAAARDFVDVYTLAGFLGEERLAELAAQKDVGFDQRHFADALGAFARLDRDLFEVSDATYESIRSWSDSWRTRLLERGIEQGIPELRPDRGDDLGLGL